MGTEPPSGWPPPAAPRGPRARYARPVTGRPRARGLARPALGVLPLLAAGCAALAPSVRCPEEGGVPWRELATEHFLVWTDLDAAEARALAARLEWIRAAVVAAVWQAPVEPEARLAVVALRSEGKLRLFTRGELEGEKVFKENGHGAVTLKPLPGGFPVIVTGPNRDLFRKTSFPFTFAAPGGNTMMTGPMGLVRAAQFRLLNKP